MSHPLVYAIQHRNLEDAVRGLWYSLLSATSRIVTYSTADELPQITFISAQIVPGTSRVTVEASEPKFESFVNEKDPLVVGYQSANLMIRQLIRLTLGVIV
jgi:hypothetical protein